MTNYSNEEIRHNLTFSQPFTFNSKLIFVFDREARNKVANGIDTLIARLFAGNIDEIPISHKEKIEIQELLNLRESLKMKA